MNRIKRRYQKKYYEQQNGLLTKKTLYYRWIILLITLTLYYFTDSAGILDDIHTNRFLFYFIFILSCGYNYYLSVIIKSSFSKKLEFFTVFFDFITVSFLIAATCWTKSPFFILYFFIILSVNLKYDSSFSITTTFFCILYYIFVIWHSINNMIITSYYQNVYNILILVIFAIVFEWARKYKKRTKELNANVAQQNLILKSQNEALDEQKKLLREKNKEYINMVGFVSHELKNPLTALNSLSDLLMLDDITEEERKQCASTIYDQVQSLREMIVKFLDFSKIEQRNLNVEFRNIEFFTHVIIPVVDSLKTLADAKKMRIYKHPASNVSEINTLSDPALLRVAFTNLISNAIKYGYDGTDITYTVYLINDTIHCSVSNYGEGIAEDKYQTIFEKFERLDELKQVPGTGLGLFITKSIINELGGKIWCESELKRLTTFKFTLSVVKGDLEDYENF